MSRFSGQHFDQLLYLSQGEAQYRANKVKAARIGGSMSKPSKEHCAALSLYRIKTRTEMTVLALKSIGRYEAGKKYSLTVEPGAKIVAPYPLQFKNWDEFVVNFKRFKKV